LPECKSEFGGVTRSCLVGHGADFLREGPIMSATEVIGKSQGRSLDKSLGQQPFDGYEQRLIQWGCSNCRFFEKRVFTIGHSEELDAYIICRFGGDLVDLIGEATTCPKNCDLEPLESKTKRGRLHCRYAIPKAMAPPGESGTTSGKKLADQPRPRRAGLPSSRRQRPGKAFA
jgi:hypothetical protein